MRARLRHSAANATVWRRSMAASATLTVRLQKRVSDRLAQLARLTGKTRSDLASEAISSFVERELTIVEGICRGLADMRAGRVVPHEEVMRRIEATIARATRKRRLSRRASTS